eukprot:tig00000254_g22486.t1
MSWRSRQIGTGAGCDGGLQLWFGFVPYIAANLKLDTVIKLPVSLSYRLAGHYFDSLSPIWKNTWDKIVIVQKTCPDPAPGGTTAVFTAKVTRRGSNALEFGWFWPRQDFLKNDVVAFRIAIREGGTSDAQAKVGERFFAASFRELSKAEYDAAPKLSYEGLATAETGALVSADACGPQGGTSGLVMTYDPAKRAAACRAYSGFVPRAGVAVQAPLDPSDFRITFGQSFPNLRPETIYGVELEAIRADNQKYLGKMEGGSSVVKTLRARARASLQLSRFDVQRWIPEPLPDASLTCTNVPKGAADEIICTFYAGYAKTLSLQMPGLPHRAFVTGNTSLPFMLSVTRLSCGLFNVSWIPQGDGYGGAVAALAKSVVMKMTSNEAGSKPLYFTVPVNPGGEYYSVLVNATSATQRVVKRAFVLGAVTSAGYSSTAEGSNTVVVYDRPCSATCPVDLLDDVLVACPEPARYISVSLAGELALCPFNNNLTSQAVNPCDAATDPLAARRRRRTLSAAVEALIESHVRSGRMLLADETSFSSEPPPDVGPDDGFIITEPLPIEPTLKLAADYAPSPPDLTATSSLDAEAYRSLDRFAPIPDEPGSIQAQMRGEQAARSPVHAPSLSRARAAQRDANTLQFASTPPSEGTYRSPLADSSESSCPPDHKVAVPSAGRTELPNLCSYPVTGVLVCSAPATHAVQFLFNATETGVYVFDASASAFPAVVDVRSAAACDPYACSAPLLGGEAGGRTRVSAFLRAGAPVAINVAAAGPGPAPCGADAPAQPVVLDVRREAEYDLDIVVDVSSENDTAASGRDAAVVNRLSTARALAIEFVAAAGRPVKASRSHAHPEIGATGSSIVIRSLSGLSSGPGSAVDTMLYCNNLGPAFVVSHASPAVVPMGVNLANCSRDATVEVGGVAVPPEDASGSALVVRGVKGLVVKAVVFTTNVNSFGSGGAVSLLDGASAAFLFCTFSKNKAKTHGGAVVVLGESSAIFGNSTFFHNEALEGGGGAVSVGADSEAKMAAGEVSFSGCSFLENAAGLAMADAAVYTAQAPNLNRLSQGTSTVDFSKYDPAHRVGGAIAVVKSSATVTIVGTTFRRNMADSGGAIWAGSPVAVSKCLITSSIGDGLAVVNAAASVEATLISDNGNIFNVAKNSGGGLTCLGSNAKLTVSLTMFEENAAYFAGGGALVAQGCTASFESSSFMFNGAMVGGAVSVGLPGGIIANDGGGVQLRQCLINFNSAGDIDMRALGQPGGVGQGGGIAVMGTNTPVVVEECVLNGNQAFGGGGIYAADSITLAGGKNVIFNNTAGFLWGTYGGGLALIKGTTKLDDTVIIQNEVGMADGQGAGFFVGLDARVADGSKYRATANAGSGVVRPTAASSSSSADPAADVDARGAARVAQFKNVFFAAQAKAIVEAFRTGGPDAAAAIAASATSCYKCSPCQVCGVETGRCQFPADIDSWCKYIGSCNPETCEFVSIGAAKLNLELDVEYTLPSGAGSIPCSAIFTADTISLLGASPKCSIAAPASKSNRGLLQTSPALVVDLGQGFNIQPGSSLELLTGNLPAQYSGLSNSAIIQISQAAKPVSALEQSLRSAGGNITGSSFASSSGTTAGAGGAIAGPSTSRSSAARDREGVRWCSAAALLAAAACLWLSLLHVF